MSEILQIKNVTKRYGNIQALRDVSFSIGKSEIVGLLGPNGSGKTTIIKILNSLITDYTGDIRVRGNKPGIASKTIISYLPDIEFLSNTMKIGTVFNMYNDFFEDFDMAKGKEMLKIVQLDEKRVIRTLSKGMREKLQLVLTMARKAYLYIFDEPIAGVDPAARDFILETIIKNYNEEGSILFSTHLISDIEPILSRAIFIKEGQIVIDEDADSLRARQGKSIDKIFREVFKC